MRATAELLRAGAIFMTGMFLWELWVREAKRDAWIATGIVATLALAKGLELWQRRRAEQATATIVAMRRALAQDRAAEEIGEDEEPEQVRLYKHPTRQNWEAE